VPRIIATVAQSGTAQAWKTGMYRLACFRKDIPVQKKSESLGRGAFS